MHRLIMDIFMAIAFGIELRSLEPGSEALPMAAALEELYEVRRNAGF